MTQADGTGRRLTRAGLLSTGAKRGAALVIAGSVAGALVQEASAEPLSDSDLAFARLLVGAELLSIDFYVKAMNARRFKAVGQKYMRAAFTNELDHYRSVSGILNGAGYSAATAEDFEFSYPRNSFKSSSSIARLGRELETVLLGSYLGAVAAIQTQGLVQPLARIAASEAQHLSIWGFQLGGRPISAAFPTPYTIDQVSAAMDAFAT
jgi:hypothetical protein